MEKEKILYISVDAEERYFSLGTSSGFKVFAVWPFRLAFEEVLAPLAITEVFPGTGNIALVPAAASPPYFPTTLLVWSLKKQCVLGTVTTPQQADAVQITRNRLFLSTKPVVSIYDSGTLDLIDSVQFEEVPSLLSLKGELDELRKENESLRK